MSALEVATRWEAPPWTRDRSWPLYYHAVYWLYLFAVSTSLQPFPVDIDAYAVRVEDGSSLTRIYFISLFLAAASLALRRWQVTKATATTIRRALVPLAVLLGIFLLSSLLSNAPMLALTKLAFVAVSTSVPIFLFLSAPNVRAIFLSTGCFLAVSVLACFWGVFFYPSHSIHQSYLYAGAWRGLYGHKNYAGGIMSLAIFVFQACRVFCDKNRWTWTFFSIAAAIFLYKTESKTAIILVMVAVAFSFLWTRPIKGAGLRPMKKLVAVLLVGGSAAFCFFAKSLFEVLGVNLDLTGRIPLWGILLELTSGDVLLGSGYDTFFNQGTASPLFMAGGVWSRFAAHAHNGYFNIYIFGGLFAWLAIVWFLISALLSSLKIDGRHFSSIVWMVSVIILETIRGITEVDLFTGDRVTWSLTLIAVMCIVFEANSARLGRT